MVKASADTVAVALWAKNAARLSTSVTVSAAKRDIEVLLHERVEEADVNAPGRVFSIQHEAVSSTAQQVDGDVVIRFDAYIGGTGVGGHALVKWRGAELVKYVGGVGWH